MGQLGEMGGEDWPACETATAWWQQMGVMSAGGSSTKRRQAVTHAAVEASVGLTRRACHCYPAVIWAARQQVRPHCLSQYYYARSCVWLWCWQLKVDLPSEPRQQLCGCKGCSRNARRTVQGTQLAHLWRLNDLKGQESLLIDRVSVLRCTATVKDSALRRRAQQHAEE